MLCLQCHENWKGNSSNFKQIYDPMKKLIIAAGGVVMNEHNEVLLIFRRGCWDLPKGKLDEGETVAECALREVKEETALEHITQGAFIADTFHQYEEKGQPVTKQTSWYLMQGSSKETPVPQTEEDIAEIRWVPTQQLSPYLANTYPNIIEILRKAIPGLQV